MKRGVTLHTDAGSAEVVSADIAFASSGTHREQVEELLRQHPGGLTQHQCAELLGWNSRDNVNPRMQELKEMGLAYQPGERRATGLGGYAEVWKHSEYAQAVPSKQVKVESTGRLVTRYPRAVPEPKALCDSERELRRHERKPRRRGAQSKKAEPVVSRPQLTPEQKEARQEEARRRADERVQATLANR